jgi:hypothetical protein
LRASPKDLRHALLSLDHALNGFLTKPDHSVVVETPRGMFPVKHDPVQGLLKSPALTELAEKAGTVNLECGAMEPWSFRPKLEPSQDVTAAGSNLTPERGTGLAFALEDAALIKNHPLSLARRRDF